MLVRDMNQQAKDPIRVATGRLGGLTTAARGRHVTGPARAAWEARVAAEFGIDESLDPAERARRFDAALRVRMTRLAAARWGKKKPVLVTETIETGAEVSIVATTPPQRSGLVEPRIRHVGQCGWRTACWRAECRERFGSYVTIEVLADEVLAHCHRGSYRKGAPGPGRAFV